MKLRRIETPQIAHHAGKPVMAEAAKPITFVPIATRS